MKPLFLRLNLGKLSYAATLQAPTMPIVQLLLDAPQRIASVTCLRLLNQRLGLPPPRARHQVGRTPVTHPLRSRLHALFQPRRHPSRRALLFQPCQPVGNFVFLNAFGNQPPPSTSPRRVSLQRLLQRAQLTQRRFKLKPPLPLFEFSHSQQPPQRA